MSSYVSADSPKGPNELEQFNRNVQDTSKAIQEFHQLTKSMQQKMTLFSTAQDSRVNHQQLKELTEKGNKLVAKINRRLQDLTKACQGPSGRTRKTQVSKLSSDYKNQLKAFEETCEKFIENEKTAVANIRQSSHSFRSDDNDKRGGLGDYSEDQLYSQANIQNYNEDDLARREEDILHINHQMREVNAAFREVDDLITVQGEVVVEIADDTDNVKDNVEGALDQVRQADTKRGYFQCTKWKMMCWGFLLIILAAIILAIILAAK